MHGRIILAVLAGTGATLAILFGMSVLIDSGPSVETEPRVRDELIFIREVREASPPVDERPPVRPPAPPQTPETTAPSNESTTGRIRVGLAAPEPAAGFDGSVSMAINDGPLVPVLRVQPNYPNRAVTQGIEGHVIVEFTVTADGTTAGHRVIESTHSIFDAAALRAAERFRFRPRVIDGVTVETRGVRNRFRFEMDTQ